MSSENIKEFLEDSLTSNEKTFKAMELIENWTIATYEVLESLKTPKKAK